MYIYESRQDFSTSQKVPFWGSFFWGKGTFFRERPFLFNLLYKIKKKTPKRGSFFWEKGTFFREKKDLFCSCNYKKNIPKTTFFCDLLIFGGLPRRKKIRHILMSTFKVPSETQYRVLKSWRDSVPKISSLERTVV